MRFVEDWKELVSLAQNYPDAIVSIGPWPARSCTAAEGRKIMQEKLHRKISQHDPRLTAYWESKNAIRVIYPNWGWERQTKFKKYANDDFLQNYESDRRLLHAIRTKRARIYQFSTKFYRENFGHLLASRDED